MEAFDEVHVVSDLHLGGWAGRQVFNQGRALAAFVLWVRDQARAGRRVACVLNGDVVDFLAARGAPYLDYAGARARFEEVSNDPAFAPAFDALGALVREPHARLVLALGNHDLEMALPEVREAFLLRLAVDDAGRGRVRFALDGTGFTCAVGGRVVHCAHGNDDDAWNLIEHESLRRAVRSLNQGVAPDAWEPNAGTRLVVDVMNRVKERYAFVDLLKPETLLVPPVLMALPDAVASSLLPSFAASLARRAFDVGRHGLGLLSADPSAPPSPDRALEDLLAEARQQASAAPQDDEGGALARMNAEVQRGGLRDPLSLAPPAGGDDTLGVGGMIWDRLRGADPCENLRDALARYVARDATYDPTSGEDEAFGPLDARVGPEVHFVIAGHTHLERRLARRRGAGVYFNSGTWIRLLRLTKDMVEKDAFGAVYAAILNGSMEALDAVAVKGEALVVQRRTVVSVWADGAHVHGALRHARPAPASGDAHDGDPWEPADGPSYAPYNAQYQTYSVERAPA